MWSTVHVSTCVFLNISARKKERRQVRGYSGRVRKEGKKENSHQLEEVGRGRGGGEGGGEI